MGRRGRRRKRRRYGRDNDAFSADGESWYQTTPTQQTTRWTRTCKHWREPFELEAGLIILASAATDEPYSWEDRGADIVPDVGFYLDDMWTRWTVLSSPGWTPEFMEGWEGTATRVVHFPWDDASAPDSIILFGDAVPWVVSQIDEGQVVETGCIGGHGRTGTMLACLLVFQGVEPGTAIRRVRRDYCFEAIETKTQEEFVHRFSHYLLTGEDIDVKLPPQGTSLAVKTEPIDQTILDRWDAERVDIHGHKMIQVGDGIYVNENYIDKYADEYKEWQRLNQDGIDEWFRETDEGGRSRAYWRDEDGQWHEAGAVEYSSPDESVACPYGGCILPESCSPEDGDCFEQRRREAVSGIDDYGWTD